MADNRAHIKTDIPAQLDRLPWGRFHTLVIAALGVTWILDGLEHGARPLSSADSVELGK